MKLYYAPGACSLGIHVLLEEIGKPYEAIPLKLREGEQHQPAFVAVNPKSKVPTLVRDDGSVLTEYLAIAMYLANTNPEAHLVPTDPEAQVRMIEATDYAVGTVHMQAFSRLFRASNYAPSESDHEAVKAKGREMAEKGFAILSKSLGSHDYVAGAFSIADTAMYYVERWAGAMGVALPDNLAAHRARMTARPAVAAVLAKEGLTP